MAANSPMELKYRRSCLDHVEDIEKYRREGFHPIHLGDCLKGGRYYILHKLGCGGFSTVWLPGMSTRIGWSHSRRVLPKPHKSGKNLVSFETSMNIFKATLGEVV